MNAPAAAAQFDGMFQVKHLMVDEILDRVLRHARVVENLADDDSIVSGIIVAERIARVHAAPRHLRTREQAIEEARVEVVKDGVEVIAVSLGADDLLAAAHLANEMRLAGEIVAGNVSAIARGVLGFNGLAVDLRDEDVKDGVQDTFGRAFQQIGNAQLEDIVTEANGVVDVRERIKPYLELRHGGTGTQFPVGVLEKFVKILSHGDKNRSLAAPGMARGSGSSGASSD